MSETEVRRSEAIQLWTRVIIRAVLMLLALALLLWLLYELRTILLLLILSVFFCYLIAPIVRLFEQPMYIWARELKLPRGVAVLFVYLLFGGALFIAIQSILPVLGDQLSALAKALPDYISKESASARQTIQGVDKSLRRLGLPGEISNDVAKWSTDVISDLLPKLRDLATGVLGYLVYLPWLILVPILSFFMLKDAEKFADEAVSFLPGERLQRRARRLLVDVSKTLAAYIRAQITSCLVVGTIATGGLVIIGLPYAVVLGAVVGVMEFIPMVGPLIAILTCFVVALLSSLKLALIVVLFLGCLRVVEDYVIYPRIIGQGIRMHPLVVIIAILCGAELDGVIGVFLAIPLVGLLMVGYNHYGIYKKMKELGINDTGELAVPPRNTP